MTDICRDSVYDRDGVTNQWGRDELFGSHAGVAILKLEKKVEFLIRTYTNNEFIRLKT